MRDGEMVPDYRRGYGWLWPVNNTDRKLPPYYWSFCPHCGQDLPPILSDEAVRRIMRAILAAEPEWLTRLKRNPDWQADGEGEE
jgi:hypothetical protein